MSYDYKAKRTVALIADSVEVGVALNIVGHLGITLGAHAERDIVGRDILEDSSGVRHMGISKYPVIIKRASSSQIRRAIEQARTLPDVAVADYPREMLVTGHDDELAEALSRVGEIQIEYLGALFYGPTASVDSICRKYSLWR